LAASALGVLMDAEGHWYGGLETELEVCSKGNREDE